MDFASVLLVIFYTRAVTLMLTLALPTKKKPSTIRLPEHILSKYYPRWFSGTALLPHTYRVPRLSLSLGYCFTPCPHEFFLDSLGCFHHP